MKKVAKILFPISVALFILAAAWGVLCTSLCSNSNEDNYKELQPESFVPDDIETVLHDDELGQLYVCYNEANCVNVYTENGKFLWCVVTPYLRNSYFEIQDGKLFIYSIDAYVYDAENGKFLYTAKEDDLDLSYDWENDTTDQFEAGEFYFDDYQVYRSVVDGELEVIVERPEWHRFLSFYFNYAIAMLGALGIGISIFCFRTKEYTEVKDTTDIEDRKARFVRNYFRVNSIVHITYVVLNILVAFFASSWFVMVIIPITLHFIVSNIILNNMFDRLSCSENEMKIVRFWRMIEVGSYIAAFFSVIVASSIAG